jgi:acetyl esterase/lipase
MKYQIDPDFQSCVLQTFEELNISPGRPAPQVLKGDVQARRQGASFAKVVLALEHEVQGIVKTRYTVPREDGYELPVFAYRKEKKADEKGLKPAVMYFHGGGMIFGSAELFEPVTKADVAATGVTHFSV